MTWWAQNGEDQIAAGIFAMIGTVNHVAVEFGAGDGWENSNTAYFRDHGWSTFLFDIRPDSPIVEQAAITAENINQVFAHAGIPHTFDLLSIDIDGNDLWVWKALDFCPRVVIVEYNPWWGVKKSRAVPYDPARTWDGTVYYGASVAALKRLGKQKGYTLVAATRSNLVFAPKGLLPPLESDDIPMSRKVKRPDEAGRKWVAYQ